jgi:photosystem II stability/assembly factor-like uncharacterized protein
MRTATSKHLLLGFLAVLFLVQCRKERIQLSQWTVANTPIRAECTSIWMLDSLRGFATAGTSWEVGYLLSTTDGGLNWQVDDTLYHKMEHVMADATGYAYAVGQSGICCERAPGTDRWILYREDYAWHRACYMTSPSKGMIVSGESFGRGQVRSCGPDYFWALDTTFDFPNQLQSIWATSTQNWHACGLGWVIRSTDGGRSWERARVSDDFFTDIHFPTAQTGYCCGNSGTLLKTTDGGTTWKTLREGGASKPKRQPFRSMWFEDEQRGWIAGDNGLLWRTTDGGHAWAVVENTPGDVDFKGVFARNGKGWVCGTGGVVVGFE